MLLIGAPLVLALGVPVLSMPALGADMPVKAPPMAAPIGGATQNIHNCCSAHPPAKRAGPVLRAGFTDKLVTGMPIKWLNVSPRPIAIGATPGGARLSVALKRRYRAVGQWRSAQRERRDLGLVQRRADRKPHPHRRLVHRAREARWRLSLGR